MQFRLENSLSFPDIFNLVTKQAEYSTGVESINECLNCLLLTSRGELLGDPGFGTDIMKCVYDYNNAIMNDIIRTDIVRAVSEYMPRLITVRYEDIEIINDLNEVKILVKYYINKVDSIGTYELVVLRSENNE